MFHAAKSSVILKNLRIVEYMQHPLTGMSLKLRHKQNFPEVKFIWHGLQLLRKKIIVKSHICCSHLKGPKISNKVLKSMNMMMRRLLVSLFQEGTQKTMSRPIWSKPRCEDRIQIWIKAIRKKEDGPKIVKDNAKFTKKTL